MDAGKPPVGIIGAGRLAWSLAPALRAAGYDVACIASRSRESAARLASSLAPAPEATGEPAALLDRAVLVFLTVPDAELAPLARTLPWRSHHHAVHCSGARGLDVLDPARAAGGARGCLHFLQTFPAREARPDRFRGTAAGFEGDPPLGDLLAAVARALGSRPFALAGVERAAYHAAAVFASNDAVALMSLAARAWAAAGLPLDSAREALAPLLLATAENIAANELPRALSGPVARGDAETVAGHLAAFATDPSLREPYRLLAHELLRVADLDPPTRMRLEDVLGATAPDDDAGGKPSSQPPRRA